MGKNLLIVGASSEIAIKFLRASYDDYEKIYLQYRTLGSDLEGLAKELSAHTEIVLLQADLSDTDSVFAMINQIKETGALPNHIVHLAAPKIRHKQFHKENWESFENGWEISVHSIVNILQAFMPSMAKQKYGRVIFMLTSCTNNEPPKFQSAYVMVKYALLGLMKSLAVDYADKGITVNGVSPGMMETKFLSELPELIIEQNRMNSPLGRNINIEEILPVMKYMLSDMGASMTGQNIVISGGQ